MSVDWGLTDELLDESVEETENAQRSAGLPMSGVYPVEVEKVYLAKSQGGATSFNVEMTEIDPDNPLGGRTLYYTGWIKSGDEKGNKATYTDKNGKEQPLPSWFQVKHFLKACGTELKQLKPKDATVERFGNQEEVKAFPELTGKKLKAVVQQYESEYNGETSIRYDVIDFINLDGTATGKGRDEKQWESYLERVPLKGLRKKQEPKKELTEEAKKALSGW